MKSQFEFVKENGVRAAKILWLSTTERGNSHRCETRVVELPFSGGDGFEKKCVGGLEAVPEV